MVMNFAQRFSIMLAITLAVPYQQSWGQPPSLSFMDGKVWLQNIDQETLYTFCRYNDQSDWREIFPVRTNESSGISIDGIYEIFERSVSFTPRFPFASSVRYVAEVQLEELTKNYNEVYLEKKDAQPLRLEFSPIIVTGPTPEVVRIYPSLDVLPENILKFHIVFNTSMTRGDIMNRVKLLDDQGNLINKAFLQVDQEFWDHDMKIATILLDPGRIKRGLRPNREMGLAFTAGHKYKLIIDGEWKTSDGHVLKKSYVKEFASRGADRKKPHLNEWKINPPRSANNNLNITLEHAYDWVLLSDGIRIIDSKGHAVKGSIITGENEFALSFEPEAPWKDEEYTVLINPLLEDLAGNNFERLFDEDLQERSGKPGVLKMKFQPNFVLHKASR
jgi:hypothetical protein